MRPLGRDRWLPVLLSVLVHGAILLALGWGWWTYRKPAPIAHTLAIQGSVVSAAALRPVPAPPAPVPVPAPVAAPQPEAPPPTPAPDPALVRAEQQAAAKAAQERQAVAERAEEQASAEREARKRAEAAAAQATKAEQEKQAKAEADRQAKAAADRRAAAEKQALQKEISDQLEAEKRLNAARDSGQQDQYVAMIRNHITRQWIKPPATPPAMDCVADVRQIPGGEVTGVQFIACDASAAIKQSVEDAIYRASPLPAPPTPDLFESVLRIHFHGSDQ